MNIILPVICFGAIFLLNFCTEQNINGSLCLRELFLKSAIIWGATLIAITEALSVFNFFTAEGLLLSWGIITTVLLIAYLIITKKRALRLAPIPKLSVFQIILLCSMGIIIIAVGMIALIAPPNNWDSMVYHMSRVVHWAQNKSVAHYPTYTTFQLYYPPAAEFIIAHLQILNGGDRFANLIQWASMVGSIMGVSMITKRLGGQRNAQIIASVICATIPMGILQGSSTQNDYVVSFWLVCLVYFILSAMGQGIGFANSLMIGASLGMALLTKLTAYIFALPFLIWFAISIISRFKKSFFKFLTIVAMTALLLNAGHYIRNTQMFGSPLYVSEEITSGQKMAIFGFRPLLSNTIRNLAFHFDFASALHMQGIFPSLNAKAQKAVFLIHKTLGMDVNDPKTTMGKYSGTGLSFNEDVAGNPLHFVLFFFALFAFILHRRFIKTDKTILFYTATAMIGFLIFNIFLKWCIYNSRYELPVFVLSSPFIAISLSTFSKNSKANYAMANIIAAILIIASFQWLLMNSYRPLMGENNIFKMRRCDQYFATRKWLKKDFFETVEFIKSKRYSKIGFLPNSATSWEYPFWPLLEDKTKNFRFEHINVSNRSSIKYKTLLFNNFIPSVVIRLKPNDGKMVRVGNDTFVQAWSCNTIDILVKKDGPKISTDMTSP